MASKFRQTPSAYAATDIKFMLDETAATLSTQRKRADRTSKAIANSDRIFMDFYIDCVEVITSTV
jgi:hypothetical protein